MKYFPDDVKGITARLLYIKMDFSAGWSWIVLPGSIITNLATILIFLKFFNLWKPIWIITGGIVFFVLIMVFGWILRVKNIIQREANIQARYNPPMRYLIKSTEKIMKKLKLEIKAEELK